MLIGYARVSTQDQDARAQVEALEKAGCELIFQERISGGRWDRPELHRMLKQLRKGDVVIVWKLDRLSRSLIDVLNLMEMINRAKAGFRSLTEAIDTTTPAGRISAHSPWPRPAHTRWPSFRAIQSPLVSASGRKRRPVGDSPDLWRSKIRPGSVCKSGAQ